MSKTTQVLQRLHSGDSKATEELLPLVYDELRRLAAAKMAREKPGQTLQATALVHEAFLRLVREKNQAWKNTDQFCTVAAEAMRRILVDRARRKLACKHGAGAEHVDISSLEIPAAADDELNLKVNEVLEEFAREDSVKAEVVKLRFYAGLENEEIALLLDISEKTVRRHWTIAKARLFQLMTH